MTRGRERVRSRSSAGQRARRRARLAGRHRARPAHLGHDLAAEDRAAGAPALCLLGANIAETLALRSRTTAASTSCRCSTSTASSRRCSRRSPPGASVVCTPGFNAPVVLRWLAELEPTWYTAVPTMHQAILARAPRPPTTRRRTAALHPLVVGLACPPRDRGARGDLRRAGRRGVRHDRGGAPDGEQPAAAAARASRARSGRPAGPRSPIIDDDGDRCRRATIGEIVIRGPNVTAGYETNPEANADGVRRRLVPHRRPGHDRRRRLPLAHRPAEGDHQPRRREDLPARGRRGRCWSTRRSPRP